MVIDDRETFEKLIDNDQRNDICECIEQIEKNITGKDQKKYARRVYRAFVNFVFKRSFAR